jgi:hypothetical protein
VALGDVPTFLFQGASYVSSVIVVETWNKSRCVSESFLEFFRLLLGN